MPVDSNNQRQDKNMQDEEMGIKVKKETPKKVGCVEKLLSCFKWWKGVRFLSARQILIELSKLTEFVGA